MDSGADKTRIYVGGLGVGVTDSDLRQTFSSLGQVASVDIVRTKDRSFAYLDFIPSSDKSLPKLFSTYNGCMWKGGRLRLEKAKEHFLVKMKREWDAEEAELATKAADKCEADAVERSDALAKQVEKPKKPSPVDLTQIHIFFPKLGKVKSLAQVGIGKHKYSFQRIQVPSIPTHFCDCEEHSLAFPPPNRKQSSEIDNASYEVNEQELNIMNSVMNKIFERANPSKKVIEKPKSTNGIDDPVAAETDDEDHLTDEDNLIINVSSRKNDSMDMLNEMRAMMANQKTGAKKLNTSTEKPNSMNDNPQKKTVPLTKKRKSSSEETSKHSRPRLDTQENSKKEVKLVTEELGTTSLRSLKSTWQDMLGQKRKTSFSISDFIASIPQRKEEESNGDDSDHPLKKNDSVSNGDITEPGSKTEVGEVITVNSIPNIVTNDYQHKEEKPKAENLDLPLVTIGQPLRSSDAVAGDFDQKGEEPETVDLDQKEEKTDTDDLDQKEKEPETDDLDQKEEEPEIDDLDQKEEEPETDDLACNFENHENDQNLKKPTKDSPVKNDEDLTRTARGEFWRHKSSWTQLISTASHTSFSISQIVPSISSGKHEQEVDTSNSQPANKNLDDQIPVVTKEATLPPVKKNIPEKRKILSLGNLESDETCSFMRTAKSIKEWKKAKASSSGALNKKKRLVKESA